MGSTSRKKIDVNNRKSAILALKHLKSVLMEYYSSEACVGIEQEKNSSEGNAHKNKTLPLFSMEKICNWCLDTYGQIVLRNGVDYSITIRSPSSSNSTTNFSTYSKGNSIELLYWNIIRTSLSSSSTSTPLKQHPTQPSLLFDRSMSSLLKKLLQNIELLSNLQLLILARFFCCTTTLQMMVQQEQIHNRQMDNKNQTENCKQHEKISDASSWQVLSPNDYFEHVVLSNDIQKITSLSRLIATYCSLVATTMKGMDDHHKEGSMHNLASSSRCGIKRKQHQVMNKDETIHNNASKKHFSKNLFDRTNVTNSSNVTVSTKNYTKQHLFDEKGNKKCSSSYDNSSNASNSNKLDTKYIDILEDQMKQSIIQKRQSSSISNRVLDSNLDFLYLVFQTTRFLSLHDL